MAQTKSRSFGARVPVNLAQSNLYKGGVVTEVADVRRDGEAGFFDLEKMANKLLTDSPHIDWLDLAAATTFLAAGGTMVVRGRKLLAGQSFASVTLGASLDIVAVIPGEAGNDLSVEIINTGVAHLAVSYASEKLTINLGGDTSTEDQIAAAINVAAQAWTDLIRANSGGGAAFGVVAETPLIGGVGYGLDARVGGVACKILRTVGGATTTTANFTDSSLSLTVPALTGSGLAANDKANVEIISSNLHAGFLGVTLA